MLLLLLFLPSPFFNTVLLLLLLLMLLLVMVLLVMVLFLPSPFFNTVLLVLCLRPSCAQAGTNLALVQLSLFTNIPYFGLGSTFGGCIPLPSFAAALSRAQASWFVFPLRLHPRVEPSSVCVLLRTPTPGLP